MWGIPGVCTLALTVAKTSSHYDRFAIPVPARSLLLFNLAVPGLLISLTAVLTSPETPNAKMSSNSSPVSSSSGTEKSASITISFLARIFRTCARQGKYGTLINLQNFTTSDPQSDITQTNRSKFPMPNFCRISIMRSFIEVAGLKIVFFLSI